MIRSIAALLTALVMIAAPLRSQPVDHTAFDTLLARHVTEEGLVDYDAFAASETFDRYLARLDSTDPSPLSSDEHLALWINAYNAYTIELINMHDERASIRKINRTLGIVAAKGPWSQPVAHVGGTTYTLDEIEHEIVRKRFDEPRIHFALVCAALGCPPLRREAYEGRRLDEQLDDQARWFLLHSPEKNRVDVSEKTVYLSKIFDWYGEDFGGSPASIGRYLARYYLPGPQRELLLSGDFDIKYTEYDWALNLAP